MTTGTSRIWTRLLVPFMALFLVLQLTGCGDKEADQRKAFIDFLQNTAMRSGEHLPSLSEDQKQKFGAYVSDYAIIYGFSQQVNKAVDSGLKPVVDELSAIRTPQDYLTRRDSLRQASGSLGVLAQQIQAAKTQADSSKGALKQPEELKTVYDNVYNKVVTQPAASLAPLLPALQTLSQDAVQTGDFLQQQGTRVSFNGSTVQFPTQEQATQYNTLMSNLSANAQALPQAQSALQGGFQ
ncbi:hypothetical protein WB66_20475 [bacteria symbiont BFo1 of Frankliniella occidentalis]|jgi:hypothetical protein|uniref:DUF3053 domain-containing protein n=1 Tax=Erwinia aphidicola TaxID=68334 RepID=A0ABU8DIH1_ERWAP|nr:MULTISPECIES: DUF3053 domain-containing protein [Erwinia]KMV68195.1 hypothetical protein AI28_14360 [bacteria symbiont BFo1 of Frankliniella occidentalis]PIJ55970.1 hypothetical protein BOM23_17860 [Erwinia sp. OLMDLW33]VTT27836.1 lipoprotein [Klebsiella pneumoniae]KYP83040.1 hypothetical protein WB66_20475 [bacteria symbiont BFo1 of Frankliniella occidentalis]KYP87696.1 hypothetical protein WB91_20500 [bacteria symbiont BFo1 of Frankliniella occidentalis]